jgi:hypothetical protein
MRRSNFALRVPPTLLAEARKAAESDLRSPSPNLCAIRAGIAQHFGCRIGCNYRGNNGSEWSVSDTRRGS